MLPVERQALRIDPVSTCTMPDETLHGLEATTRDARHLERTRCRLIFNRRCKAGCSRSGRCGPRIFRSCTPSRRIRSSGRCIPIRTGTKKMSSRSSFAKAIESGGALVALDASDGRVIGSSRFHGYDEAKSEIEIGWTFLARSHWGGVYNGEMKALMLGARLHVREYRRLSRGPGELAVAEGAREDWRGARRSPAERTRPAVCRLPDHPSVTP